MLAEEKARRGHVVSVCLPARDEAATVGPIVEQLRRHLVEGCGLVDEVLVLDDHSVDATARIAATAGARVLAVDDVLPELGPGEGKGEALYKSVAAAEGDLIAWCDSDIVDFGPHFVVGLLGPLLARPDIQFVKGFYDRPVAGSAHGGGRVTELMARPGDRRAVPAPVLDRPAPVRRVRRPASAARAAALRAGLRRRPRSPRRHRRPRGHRGHRPGRPRAAPPSQPLARRARARRHWPCCRRRSAGAAARSTRPATLVRPDLEPVEVAIGERPPLVEVSGYRRQSA